MTQEGLSNNPEKTCIIKDMKNDILLNMLKGTISVNLLRDRVLFKAENVVLPFGFSFQASSRDL